MRVIILVALLITPTGAVWLSPWRERPPQPATGEAATVALPDEDSRFALASLSSGGEVARPDIVEPCHLGEPTSLDRLVSDFRIDTVVLGRVTGIFRQSETPIGSKKRVGMPHTVFNFAVEEWLRAAGQLPPAASIKVIQTGILLPGRSQVIENQPLLTPGRRYLLFLSSPDLRRWKHLGGAPYGETDPSGKPVILGLSALLDEYWAPVSTRGRVMLSGGRCYPVADRWQTTRLMPDSSANRHEWGPRDDLFAMTEAAAVARVKEAIATWRSEQRSEQRRLASARAAAKAAAESARPLGAP